MKILQASYAGSSTRVSRKPGRKLPEFAFIGRSNVGKSSLINMLCGQSKLALTSATPGKTKVVNHFLVNDKWYLVDLPGYGYAKMSNKGREELAAVISDYVRNSQEMVMLFVLVDSRHEITATDLEFISFLGENQIPFGIIFTKGDKMGPNALKAMVEKDCEILSRTWEELPPMFTSSSRTAAGREEILNYIESILASL
ncbi:MAG: YihA family ribosome biogenesis GTP-binding protein [Bacteroidales bacterium]|jgi:GTP-binding protein|nr:YihA family ribosome biogenesis GTP-binding protein [Bacteroidales bacterium]MBQ1905676.1 YihA family ribosome biogenesis GTP-binding protein [Bacteroidales bacterium]MBQ2104115.1 YihA family ribosome biogenesis GTP-binding protein [Bacteroidales bacterium]MBQ2501628.1 YihA family ribosome biogenesis GTP-binding protein [Bacteroidales bacterium]MBQ3984766.1 YihA family ribosome biogenesis GTP-binding protein [Bacteroidales bacterium]